MAALSYEDLVDARDTLEKVEVLLQAKHNPLFVQLLEVMSTTKPEAAWIMEGANAASEWIFNLASAIDDLIEEVVPPIGEEETAEAKLYSYVEAQAAAGNEAAKLYLSKWPRSA